MIVLAEEENLPGGQIGNGEGSLKSVSMGEVPLFWEFVIDERVMQFPIVESRMINNWFELFQWMLLKMVGAELLRG